MIDNDFPIKLRPITEDEASLFPKHEEPKVPSKEDDDEKEKKIKHEKEHGHPAFAVRDEFKARGEKVD